MAFTGNFTCDSFKTALLNGAIDFSNDAFKIALYTNEAALDAATTTYSSGGEVVAVGYLAGGLAITPSVGSQDGVSYVSFTNAVWAGALTARGALIYKVGAGDPAICVLDFGADRTSTTQFAVQFPAATYTTAILRLR